MTEIELMKALRAPFPPDKVKSRKQGGRELHYIDARLVMDRLDQLLGIGGWSNRFEFHGDRTLSYLTLKLPSGELVTKVDGAGDTNIEGEKGGLSDALKRSAVMFGIGRYLYSGVHPKAYYEAYQAAMKKKETKDEVSV
jgi:hypothetical protein